jgi:O-antigen/teichoic acid export membrane protein
MGRVARNTGAATLAQVANALAGYVLLYLVASLLGRQGVGVLGVVISISLIGQLVATLGTYLYLPRLMAHHPERTERAFGSALVIALAASVAVLGLVYLFIGIGLVPEADAGVARLGVLAIVPGALAEVCEGVFAGRERMGLTAASNVIEGLSRLVLMPILLLGLGWGLYAAVGVWVIGRCIGLLLNLVLIRVRLSIVPRLPDRSGIRAMLMAALPLSGTVVLFLLFSRGDVPLLAHISGTEAAGLLVGGYRPVELASMLPTSLIFALYPALSREMRLGADHARRITEKGLVLVMVLIAGGTVGLALEANLVVHLLLPSALSPAASVLSISCWSLIPATIDAATTALLLAQGRYKAALGPLLLGLVALAAVNLWLDPRLGAEGAATARVLAQSVATGAKMILVYRLYASRDLLSKLGGIAAAAGLLGLILWAAASRPLLAIPAGVAGYLLVVFALRVVTRADLAGVVGVFGGGKREEVAASG